MEAGRQTESEDKAQRSFGKKLLVTAVKFVLAVIVIYFAGRQLVANWSEVSQYHWTIDPLLIVLSVVLHLVTFALFSKVWCLLIGAFGHQVPLRHGFKIAYIANLGRYIPGKIWPVIGMVYLLKQINISKETAFASWGIATLLGLPPAFLAGAITVFFFPEMLTGSLSGDSVTGPVVAIALTFGASLFL
ncbi:MAG: lysylphosphatidylglycerol synthase domain-containing protein, partial [candidate division Zixibacteria bacterium]|nr:lysylphosphatidylglycerol synthase domain-containing protein [candidate division Zixibacteria bacterium]